MATTLFDVDGHKNIILEDLDLGEAIQANQHLIISGNEAMILDPGGPKTFRKAYPEALSLLGRKAELTHLFMSHQDPDIVAALNPWLSNTNATGYMSKLWAHFVPHFGLSKVMLESCKLLPDEGGIITVGNTDLLILPAHYLHSCGNFQVYDPTSKILYSGDLGASLGADYIETPDFDAHIPYMAGFHRRYMGGTRAMTLWANMARKLDIEIIAPQHGALFRGKAMVERFIDWCDGFECGIDILDEYAIPTQNVG